VARLRAGSALFVTPEVASVLDLLRDMGVSERGVRVEHDVWVLMRTVSPAEAAVWLADEVESLADPEFRRLYLDHDEAFGFSPDDPRLPALAERTAAWMSKRPEVPVVDPEISALALEAAGASSPAWDTLRQQNVRRKAGPPSSALSPFSTNAMLWWKEIPQMLRSR
jgi:hypothetical protein